MIEAILAETHGRISGPSGAAAKLGIPRQTLESKIRRLGIDRYGQKRPTSKSQRAAALRQPILGLHVQSGNWLIDGSLHGLAAGVAGRSNGVAATTGRALGVVDSKLRLQGLQFDVC
jgi:Bacterial regulatory protein, Fis family